jgi:hypothetical protein
LFHISSLSRCSYFSSFHSSECESLGEIVLFSIPPSLLYEQANHKPPSAVNLVPQVSTGRLSPKIEKFLKALRWRAARFFFTTLLLIVMLKFKLLRCWSLSIFRNVTLGLSIPISLVLFPLLFVACLGNMRSSRVEAWHDEPCNYPESGCLRVRTLDCPLQTFLNSRKDEVIHQ